MAVFAIEGFLPVVTGLNRPRQADCNPPRKLQSTSGFQICL